MKNAHPQLGRVSTAAILTIACFVIGSAFTAFAQSGRRVRKPAPVAVTTPEASPTPTPQKALDKPPLPVFLGVNANVTYNNIPLYFNDSVAKSCAERLSQRSGIKVEFNLRDLTRGEAVKRAKNEKQGFVVLLELRSERINTDGRNSDLSRVYIEYAVFAAGSGKQVTSGNAYQQASGLRDVIVGGSNSASAAEYRLKQAARVAAERILAVLAEREP